jgi:VanZ family protein
MMKRIGPRIFRLGFWAAVLLAFVMAALPQPPQLPGQPSDKLLHIIAFATLALLGSLAFPRIPLLKLTLALSVFGAAIELVQAVPALNRDSEFLDWIADTAAAAFVLFLVFLWRRRTTAS